MSGNRNLIFLVLFITILLSVVFISRNYFIFPRNYLVSTSKIKAKGSYRVLLVGWLHHKNLNALMKYKNIVVVCVASLPKSLSSFDVVYCPSMSVDVSLYPGVRFIFGPHFSVFPEASHLQLIRGSIYIQPSQWVVDFWKGYDSCQKLNLRVMPFGVDTDMFRPLPKEVIKEHVVVYFKHRKPEELEFIENFLRLHNVTYRIFTYGSYTEAEYTEYFKRAKYGIWLDASESQGFALEEALSMNVPLLVWNVRSLNQDNESTLPDIFATSIPYWDDTCGEVAYSSEDFVRVYSMFLSKLELYRPREFVMKYLSMDVCERRLLDLIREV